MPATSATDLHVVPAFEISVEGSPLSPEVLDKVISVEVHQSVDLFDMFVVSFDNPYGAISELATFDQGKKVEIKLGYVGALAKLISGKIVSCEPVWPLGGTPFFVIRGYDAAHAARHGKKTRTFLKMKVSDVVQQLASEEGLSASVEATDVVHDWLLQNNQSNYELIHELGRRAGYEVEISDQGNGLSFKKPRSTASHTTELEWGVNLKSFYVRQSLADVATEVVSLGWDMKQKKAILGKSKPLRATGLATKLSTDDSKSQFSEGKVRHVIRPFDAIPEAESYASATYEERAIDAVQGRGSAIGDATIKPGVVIRLSGIGPTWGGDYYVTGTTHAVHASAGFVTEFRVRRTGVGAPSSPPPKSRTSTPPGNAPAPSATSENRAIGSTTGVTRT